LAALLDSELLITINSEKHNPTAFCTVAGFENETPRRRIELDALG
jgi:hypothetical protein